MQYAAYNDLLCRVLISIRYLRTKNLGLEIFGMDSNGLTGPYFVQKHDYEYRPFQSKLEFYCSRVQNLYLIDLNRSQTFQIVEKSDSNKSDKIIIINYPMITSGLYMEKG